MPFLQSGFFRGLLSALKVTAIHAHAPLGLRLCWSFECGYSVGWEQGEQGCSSHRSAVYMRKDELEWGLTLS